MLRDGISGQQGGGQHGGDWDGAGAGGDGAREHGERCDRLHRKLKRIVKARAGLDLEEAAALRDAQRLVIWRRYGYASLLEYMEMEMGYSPRAALERLRVAHAIVELPQLAAAMEQGDLTFSGARELTRVVTPETEEKWIASTKDMNLRELEESVSGHKRGELPEDPVDPSLRKKVLRLEVSQEAFALWRQLQQRLEQEKGHRLDDTAIVEALAGVYLRDGAETARDVAAYQVAVTVCEACKKGWQDGGNVTVEMSPANVERAMCDAVMIGHIDGADPASHGRSSVKRGGSVGSGSVVGGGGGRDGATTDAATQRPSRTIPKAIRRKVKRRDHGRCQTPACRSSRNVDIHHIDPWALGGCHVVARLITLCEAHHLALHDGTLSIRIENGERIFEREGRNNFTRVQRAVETARALKDLGYAKGVIDDAVNRTRTHVGTGDLSVEQWVAIAQRYCGEECSGRSIGRAH